MNATHDPALRSWVASANEPGCEFPIQNLPFGRYSRMPGDEPRIGVAIGTQLLDLRAAGLIHGDDMNALMAAPAAERSALRARISQGLRDGSAEQAAWSAALVDRSGLMMHLPCRIGDYTDFYTGIHHATSVGKLFRPDNPLLPNYKWVPIGYHGRGSSIGVSGQTFRRPHGQLKGAGDVPALGASQRVDYELELGILIGPGNPLGEPIPIDRAEEHLFGVCLLNDWSARDVQAWEYQPLGPFLAKNFATTISPWIVTMEALEPFRRPFSRAAGDPAPLPYLDGDANRARGVVDIALSAWLLTPAMRAAGMEPALLSRSSVAESAYWTFAQLVAHHTVNGCNLVPGDLFGSGTLSGPRPEQGGSLLELTQGGRHPIRLPNGEERTFLQDGDTIVLRGHCERDGAVRIGLGEVSATLVG